MRAITAGPTPFALFLSIAMAVGPAVAQDTPLPTYLRDRGTGVPTSLFGTYVRRGELLVYPFLEFARDNNREYQPAEFGVAGANVDFRGRFRGYAGQVFIGYGVTDWLALEFEAAYLHERLEKAPNDTFSTPARIDQQGLGDIEGQVRARVLRENERWPEIFSFVEVTFPSNKSKPLIADPDLDFKPGVGLIKGFSWGTMTTRVAVEYNREAKSFDLGEFAIEYLKRLSTAGRLYLGFEGGETGSLDEWELITGLQWRVGNNVFLKFDNSIGISSKATDWTPQVGVMVSFPQ